MKNSVHAITQHCHWRHLYDVSVYRDEKIIRAFGANLRKLREHKGLTQEDLAEKANVAVSTIARIETGLFNSSISTIALLAKALSVDKKDLVDF